MRLLRDTSLALVALALTTSLSFAGPEVVRPSAKQPHEAFATPVTPAYTSRRCPSLAVVVASALASLVFAVVSLRASGLYFILVTLALGQMVVILTRSIDLSIASNVALSGMIIALIKPVPLLVQWLIDRTAAPA